MNRRERLKDSGFDIPEVTVPAGLGAGPLPPLLEYWYLGSRARRHIVRRRAALVGAFLADGPPGRALDVGCGWGLNLHLFARAGYDAWGLDISEGELTAAGRIAAANGVACALIRGRVDVLPVRRGVFDVVTAVEVLEHVPIAARPGAVREIAAALRPGGRAIITTPNYGSFVERGKRLAVRFPLLQKLLPYTHYPPAAKRRSAPGGKDYHEPIRREELVAILREAGLDVAPPRAVIFVYKYTPDWLFGVWRAAEDLAERLPGIRGWACTAVVVARRPV